MWRKWLAPNNASRQQMGFNSGFKGLMQLDVRLLKAQAAPLLGYLLQWMTGVSGFHYVNWNDMIQFYFFFPIPSISQG